MDKAKRKKKYDIFCKNEYVPIYSKPWWMDAVCGDDNWDVWLYEKGEDILAAMPFYIEQRGDYTYITKAPLTQNNGIIFKEDSTRKKVNQARFEEEVIKAACEYIKNLHIDVYEQQYQTSFVNWSPFSWNNYTCLVRYTYVIEDTSDMSVIEEGFTSDLKRNIKKGQAATIITNDISSEEFYRLHRLVFAKQGLKCPFSEGLWDRLFYAVRANHAGDIYCAKDSVGNIHALLFLVWDDRCVYHLLGGSIPEFSISQAYAAITYHGVTKAHNMKCKYDFEGSMIERIAKSFRRFGATPMPYYRIRKVFNPDIIYKEAEEDAKKIQCELKIGGGIGEAVNT